MPPHYRQHYPFRFAAIHLSNRHNERNCFLVIKYDLRDICWKMCSLRYLLEMIQTIDVAVGNRIDLQKKKIRKFIRIHKEDGMITFL